MREQILKQNNALKNQIQAKPEKQFSKTERLKSCQEIILQENILVEKNKMEQDHVEVGLPTKKLALESLLYISKYSLYSIFLSQTEIFWL